MGSDDLDVNDSRYRPSLARGVLRILVILVGLAIGAYGIVLWALRCFDYCPDDPSLDKILMLFSAALVLTGVAVVIQGAAFRTRYEDVASGVLVFVGGLIVLAGIVSLLLLRSVDEPGSTRPNVVWPVAALLVGAAIALVGVPGRRPADGGTD